MKPAEDLDAICVETMDAENHHPKASMVPAQGNGFEAREPFLEAIEDNNFEDEQKTRSSPGVNFLTKFKKMRNLLVISVGFLLYFSAFNSIQNLASSLYNEDGLGLFALGCVYCFAVLSCVVTPWMIRKLTSKYCLIIGFIFGVIFISMTLYPRYYTMIPAAILVGVAAGPLWTAAHIYVQVNGIQFAEFTKKSATDVVSRFNGIFFAFMQSSQIFGNLVSAVILNTGVTFLQTGQVCGSSFCQIRPEIDLGKSENTSQTYSTALQQNVTNISHTSEPQGSTVPLNILIAVYIGFFILGILLLIFGLEKNQEDINVDSHIASTVSLVSIAPTSGIHLFVSSLKTLIKPKMFLIVPMSYASALNQVMIFAEFNQAFTSCELGLNWVGPTMLAFGVTDVICSYASSKLFKIVGRPPLFIFVYVVNMAIYLVMLLWHPSADHKWLFFLLPCLAGLCDSIYQPQTVTYLGVLFPGHLEAAFANHRLFHNLGYAIPFAYSYFICLNSKLYIAIAITTIAFFCYGITEIKYARKKVKSKKENVEGSKSPRL